MKTVLITGSGGLVGSETAKLFLSLGFKVIGIDNNFREVLFGAGGSTSDSVNELLLDKNYTHKSIDIRDVESLSKVFSSDISLVVHTAAQPSHDWASKDPLTDFTINANGTLNLLLATKKYCPEAVFIFTSTNKVYGDTPNRIELKVEDGLRFVPVDPKWDLGIDETMSIDNSTHSLFGVSKVSADLLVQEFGRYFGVKTACFRCGCITGANHSGVKLHGFISYLVKSLLSKNTYEIIGHRGFQVRDNIHASDLALAFYEFYNKPKIAAVYNLGGGLASNCSILEAIDKVKNIFGVKPELVYNDTARIGDHKWYISDNTKFVTDYPNWKITKTIDDIIYEYRDSEG